MAIPWSCKNNSNNGGADWTLNQTKHSRGKTQTPELSAEKQNLAIPIDRAYNRPDHQTYESRETTKNHLMVPTFKRNKSITSQTSSFDTFSGPGTIHRPSIFDFYTRNSQFNFMSHTGTAASSNISNNSSSRRHVNAPAKREKRGSISQYSRCSSASNNSFRPRRSSFSSTTRNSNIRSSINNKTKKDKEANLLRRQTIHIHRSRQPSFRGGKE